MKSYQVQKEFEHIAFECEFGDFPIDESYKSRVRGRRPVKIDLLYSDYPRGKDFSQLNQNRLKQLEGVFPEWFAKKSSIRWEIIKQIDCGSQADAEKLFHGFAIYFELPRPNIGLEDKEENSPPKNNYVPQNILSEVQSIKPKESKIWERVNTGKMSSDHPAYNFFERNADKHKNMVVVSDWTASMYDFTTQLLIYQEEMSKKNKYADKAVKAYVLFNDGGNMPTNEKKLGKTGGIYTFNNSSLEEVIQFMEYVKNTGAGGDLPENDIEAILETIENFPDAKEIFLIADNNSAIRDFSLHRKIRVPIRIILGRIDPDTGIINPQYIRLAGRTRGSIHTMERDYYTQEDLKTLYKENQEKIAQSPFNTNF